MTSYIWDSDRESRTGIAEAILCDGKSNEDLIRISQYHIDQNHSILLTRLSASQWNCLPLHLTKNICYKPESKTAVINPKINGNMKGGVGVVCAGTSDLSIALEAAETLNFYGYSAPLIADVGVAGLWRLMDKIDLIRQFRIVIAVAGMEGALFSVLAGLVKAPIIAIPSSIGYGVNSGGKNALNSALGCCSPGVLTVNIDNGFGAAIAAIKIMNIDLLAGHN
jgi:NCAIR mutase (PurE)-related protein